MNGEFHPLSLHTDKRKDAKEIFNQVAMHACTKLAETDLDLPKVKIIRFNKDDDEDDDEDDVDGLSKQLRTVAHLEVDLEEVADMQMHSGGRYSITVDEETRDDCLLAEIDCGQPLCGQRTRTKGMQKAVEEAKRMKKKRKRVQNRIVGGDETYNWPSIVAIYRDGELSCGGTIVGPTWVVTAAHCVAGFKKMEHYYDVVAGMLRRHSQSPVTHSRHAVEIYAHKEFEPRYMMNDIALIKVRRNKALNCKLVGC